jgi:hypothetical protein
MTDTDTTPTAAPQFLNNDIVAIPLKTEVKNTQGKAFTNFYAAVDFELDFGYHITAFKKGEKVAAQKCHDGVTILDGYKCHAFNAVIVNGVRTENLFIPAQLLTERTFAIVREYKTTTWEIV